MKLLNIFALFLTEAGNGSTGSDKPARDLATEFPKTLEILWKGMLAIFVAIGVIYLFILLLNYFTNLKGKKNK